MTSLNYGVDMPYEVQLEYHAATSTRHMTILEPQRSPGQVATRHLLTPGVYMVSLTYNGAAVVTLRHESQYLTNSLPVPAGTRGVPRTSAPMKISVQDTAEYLAVDAPSTGESARATISVIPASTFDEMAESAQGVSVLSEISNLKTSLDARVPADMSLRLDTSVGTRVFAGDTMIHGDTGWRSIDHLLQNGWVPEVSAWPMRLRRVGNLVELRGYVSKRDEPTSSRILELPTGFSTGAGYLGRAHGVVSGTSHTTTFHVRVAALNVNLPDYERWGQNQMFVNVAWITNDAWPTILP